MRGEWMESEIRQQPQVLALGANTYLEQLAPLGTADQYEMVLIAARGSSDNAALYARYLIEIFLGIPVSLAAPSVLTRFHKKVRYTKCLAVGISQSGAAPDISDVLESLKEAGHTTLAITNTDQSRLTHAADHKLLLNTGTEKSVAATKTYCASLLAAYELVRSLGGELPAPSALLPNDEWVESARIDALEASGSFVRNSPSFSLGRGYGFSTAQESALKMMECALLPCKAYSSADFEHGPKALAGHGSTALSYDGPMPELAAQGCEIVPAPIPPIPGTPTLTDPIKPIWDVIFGQWLALTCARARGLNPDVPQYIRKVTETL